MKRRIAILTVFLLVFLPWMVRAQDAPTLVNADFDGRFTVREAPEVTVAEGWDYDYLSGDDRWCRAPCFRPEWTPESEIVVSGTSQRWFSTFSRHYAAIHQSVAVEADQWYRFSCQVFAISENPDGQLGVRVGANPWGAGVLAHTMLWGEQQPWASYRKWHEVHVTFRAFGDRARVAVGSTANYAARNNAAYVDNCRIERVEVGGDCPECPDCPDCPPGGAPVDYDRIGDVLRGVLESLSWRAE